MLCGTVVGVCHECCCCAFQVSNVSMYQIVAFYEMKL